MNTASKKPTTRYWIIAILALLWNTLGVIAYLGQAYMTGTSRCGDSNKRSFVASRAFCLMYFFRSTGRRKAPCK